MPIDELLTAKGFPPTYHVQGREAIANLVIGEKRCGIYVLHFSDDRYYVGQSVDVTRRYVEHRRNHTDIIRLSFKPVVQADLNIIELEIMHFLKQQGLSLRNIRGIDPPPGLADFDLIMLPDAQERWLADQSSIDMSGSRLIDSELRSKYHGRFQRFAKLPYVDHALAVLQEYIPLGIPRVRASEVSFWSCSCLPESSVYARVNINWQEVFTAYTSNGALLFSFHTALSPFNFGTSLAAYFQRYPNIDIEITLDDEEQLIINGEGSEADFQKYVPDGNFDMPSELNEMLTAFFDAYPNLIISNHRYRPGGDDQFRLVATGRAEALNLLQDEEVSRAIRLLNIRLMRTGPSPYRTSHCLDLADRLVGTP